MKIEYVKANELAKEPILGSELAGGYDVRITEMKHLKNGKVWCKLGLKMAIPEGYRLMLIPRSSITKSGYVLQNSVGLIDADFRGEVQARFIAYPNGIKLQDNALELVYPTFPYEVGDRVGQVYLEKIIPIEWEEVNVLSETERGEGGHGSTGNK
jgi:dUTP pyrophosphatase